MNFAMLAPEINSGRMYGGPGSGPMTEAAMAWDRLAVRLSTAAADYAAVTAKLAAGRNGSAATEMIDAAAPYLRWLDATAAQAGHAAARAGAAASAHRSAVAATVPPPAIDANRARRRSLAAANCLGHNGPAIADTDADYERMWAQDVDAMRAYARAAADASTVTPFTLPPVTAGPVPRNAAAGWVVRSAPEMVSVGRRVISAIPEALRALSRSPLATFDATLSPVTPALSKLSSLSAPSGRAIGHLNALNKAAALRWLLPDQGGALGPRIIARMGRGTSIGTLSVPRAWSTATAPIPVYRGTVA
ncbi:PPE family protein [Mycobacterium heidelbergense]|uniref:Uncharacterized protein n=1 Tax=Mycobacterium heidelbergense TaxID=53376 RepID=A0A1X0DVC6_MYCHE|nr:PPE family protein [Mycobacterium heidelbergense]MCV7049131.1 PPE family protein [Mycobacterium heidelbergense]ORA75750.1 hypothetical protein BST25_04760 [Mycobacterium heidelbergense]BBZ48648.1 putative PPE family protein PPE32 [Mycobacterium heidelbergense]